MLGIAHNCPHLRLISLSDQTGITDDAVLGLAQRCTSLSIVDIAGCTALTDRSVIALATHCPHLERLYLKGNVLLTDVALAAVCQNNSATLDVLNVVDCLLITATAIANMLKICTNLTVLYIGDFLSDDLLCIIGNCVNLEKLSVTRAEPKVVLAIAKHCRKLLDFRMSQAQQTMEEEKALAVFIASFPLLETLVLPDDCSCFSTFSLQLLQNLRPKLRVFEYTELVDYDIEAQEDDFMSQNVF